MYFQKLAYQLGYEFALQGHVKTARAPAGAGIDDLQALRDDYYGELMQEYNPTLAQQRDQLRQRGGTVGSLAGLVWAGDDDSMSGSMAKMLGGRVVGEYLGGLGADRLTEEETPWQRMTPAQQNALQREYMEYFRRMETPNEAEQRRDAKVQGGILGGLGGAGLGALIGGLVKRPGLGALIGLPTGAAAGVGLGSMRGVNEYPSLDEIGDFGQ